MRNDLIDYYVNKFGGNFINEKSGKGDRKS